MSVYARQVSKCEREKAEADKQSFRDQPGDLCGLQLQFLTGYGEVLTDEGFIPKIRVHRRDAVILQHPQVSLQWSLHVARNDPIQLVDTPLRNGLNFLVVSGDGVRGFHGDHTDVTRRCVEDGLIDITGVDY